MGLAKQMMEESEARGWCDVDKDVCSNCVYDEALRAAIRDAGELSACSYCGHIPEAPESTTSVNLLLELVVDGFRAEYEDPVQQVAWDSREGGYLIRPQDTRDLLDGFEVSEVGELLDDLESSIVQEAWVKADPYAASPAEALQWGWDGFKNYVKKERRFSFLTRVDSPFHGAGELRMDEVPAAILRAVEYAGCVRTIKAGSEWWRVRVHGGHEGYESARDIGSPPVDHARDNRMSAKGISSFYGASTLVGARAEVAGYAVETDAGSAGKFRLLRDAVVLDLTEQPAVPSLFDSNGRGIRPAAMFVADFIEDVRKVAQPTDRQNLEYIPTQIVAECFRYDVASPNGLVQGVLWRSSKDFDVINCVIFAGNEAMADPGVANETSVLELVDGTVTRLLAPL